MTKLATHSILALMGLTIFAVTSTTQVKATTKTPVVIATDGATKPFTYTSGGNTTGYDIEVARAVFKKLPQYSVQFQVVDFGTIVPGIDSGRFQIGANDFGWTAERAQKYYFSIPLSKSNNAIAVKKNAGTYKTLKDLAGKSTAVNSASNYSKVLNDWNSKNPTKKINVSYTSGQTPFSNRLTDTVSGKTDFTFYDAISLKQAIKDMGMESQLKVENIKATAADSEHDGYEYFIFAKTPDGKKMQADVNKVLKKLNSDGTLKKLSKKYLGGDFVPAASEFK